jgi:hypothetical protein
MKSKGKQNKPKWGRNWYLLPSMVANLFAPNSSLGEKIKGAYMPSWVLLGMAAVEERVRKRNNKTINKK